MTYREAQGTPHRWHRAPPERAAFWFEQMEKAAACVPESVNHPVRSTELTDEEFAASIEAFTEEIFRIHPPSI